MDFRASVVNLSATDTHHRGTEESQRHKEKQKLFEESDHIDEARLRFTPPLVVMARIVAPPEPMSTLISFGMRPRSFSGTFKGKSDLTFPFVVPVTRCAE